METIRLVGMEGEGEMCEDVGRMWKQQKEGQEKGCQEHSVGSTSRSRSWKSRHTDQYLLWTA